MILSDGDLELDGYPIGQDWPVFVEGLDPGYPEVRSQDADNPVGDGRLFGRDFLTGPTWTLDLVVNTGSSAEARQALGELVRRWRAARTVAGKESVLRYRVGGETRLVFGRPRNLAPDPAGIDSGAITATGTFVCSDHLHYGDDQRTLAQLRLVPPPTGGFVAPFTAPIVTASTGELQGVIDDVGGDAPAPFTARIKGPVTNPYLTGDGWRIELRTTLAHDETVTIDTRKNTVLSNLRGSLGGTLTRYSRLAAARLLPGPDRVSFGGVDATGTATATITWRPAFDGF